MIEERKVRNPTFFEEKGEKNTERCLKKVQDRIEELDLDHLVIASTSGKTGAKAAELFEGSKTKVVVVSHQYGFREDGEIELEEEHRESIEEVENASLVVTPDVLTRIPKMVRGKYGGFSYLDLVADTLRIFSEGVKVCVECVVQAADSGEIPVGEEIAAVAGTGSGADTGVILEGQHSHKLFDMDIKEIVCMPRNR